MLKSLDILLGLSVVMLMVSLVVTVLTQAITNFLQTRGKNLRDGIAGLLLQIHRDLPPQVSHEVAEAILTHPLIKSAGSRYGTVIHREELTALILELAADDGPHRLAESARKDVCKLLEENGIDDPAKTMDNVRSLVLLLEQAHPELSNNERYAIAFLKEAPSRFLAKVNGWFDPTIDRVADRFTNSARIITFLGSLAVALVLQLDTAALVSRLSADPVLRQALVEQAVNLDRGAPVPVPSVIPSPTVARAVEGSPNPIPSLSPDDRRNLQTLASLDIVDFPTTFSDWSKRWTPDNWALKLLGIVLTAMLLSLGAPFWYNALKNLIRLRSIIAQKDDSQRLSRQTNTAASVTDSTAAPLVRATPPLLTGERGGLAGSG
jgi:hypothetical protein